MNATELSSTKRLLDNTSPSFCLAKWTQTSLHLESGHNRSCCHTSKQPINEALLKDNPSQLHNTAQRKEIRKQLYEGKQPSECSICWTDEKIEGHYSDRINKSSQEWALPYHDKIISSPLDDIDPSYVELSFDTVCNLKCSYCNPSTSSKWLEEIKQHGSYPTSDGFNGQEEVVTLKNREHNPFVEAFWEWWPSLYPKLKVLRLNGGEPLLSKQTFRLLDRVIDEPNPNLEFAITTNLSVPDDLIDLLIEKLNKLKVKNIFVYTSCEGYGKKAEYSRFGLDYKKWRSNCKKILDSVNCQMYVIASYSIFSPTSYSQLVEDTAEFRNRSFYIDTTFVRTPFFQSMFILDDSFLPFLEDHVRMFKKHNASFLEMNAVKRLLSLFQNRNKYKEQIAIGRRDFVVFVDEYDRRRKTDFLETFPEMEQFYYTCMKPS